AVADAGLGPDVTPHGTGIITRRTWNERRIRSPLPPATPVATPWHQRNKNKRRQTFEILP
ncbi:MAG: hypothetical protein ACXWVL_07440, partial [Rhodoplanes sp.]